MDANEARVREVWEKVDESVQRCNLTSPREWHGYVFALVDGRERTLGSGNRAERWSAAAAFTEKVLEEARHAKAAMNELMGLRDRWGENPQWLWLNKVASAAYATLTRGIKPEALEGKQ